MNTQALSTPSINLGAWRGSPENRVLSGQDEGRAARKAANLEALDTHPSAITVEVPTDLFAVTSSFFLGMFTASIRELGAEGFRKHYIFVGKDVSSVREEVIREAVRSQVALSKRTVAR